jgi:hypothetical protein
MSDLDIVAKLRTPEECSIYEKNVTERGRLTLRSWRASGQSSFARERTALEPQLLCRQLHDNG